jgi:lipoprotein-anchoring transpeptidase ErfK/SrfK
MNKLCRFATVAAVVVAASAFATQASANPFAWLGLGYTPTDNGNQVRADLRRVTVDYPTNEVPGTIIVDTPNTYLYYVLPGGKAIRYGIGVGREGFTWAGVKTVERKAEWPDWTPPPEMIARSPYLPRFMAGGATNPLGARAMYLSGSFYRIHGTNAPATIGSRATAGCIRMVNDDVIAGASRRRLVQSVPLKIASAAEIGLFVMAITSVRARPPYVFDPRRA